MRTSDIIVESVHVHPDTGHITVRVKTVTTDGSAAWTGPVRGYGCDAATFNARFNGDKQQLLNWIAQEHKGFHGAHVGLVEELTKLKGQKIG